MPWQNPNKLKVEITIYLKTRRTSKQLRPPAERHRHNDSERVSTPEILADQEAEAVASESTVAEASQAAKLPPA
jgi:hypothetical protein